MRLPVAISALVCLGACAPSFPPIAAVGGDAAFKTRMAETFPPGSPGGRLSAELARQGFAITGDPATGRWLAYDVPDNLPCLSRTRIDWREDRRGRIAVLTAQRNSCT